MSPMPDLLRLHADASGDRAAVIVDEAGGGRPRRRHVRRAQQHRRTGWPTGCGASGCSRASDSSGAAPTRSRWSRRSTPRARPGSIAVPLSYRFNADEMAYVIDNSDATLVVVDAEQAPLVAGPRPHPEGAGRDRLRRRQRPTGSCAGTTSSPAQPDERPDGRPTTADAVGDAMIYTSGTTGKPKGALRTRHRRRRSCSRCSASCDLAARERGAPHDRAALPLGPARVRVAGAHARLHRSSCCASSTRARGSTS